MNSSPELGFGIAFLALAMVSPLRADPSPTNRPPNVNIVGPASGQIFPEGTNILLGANAPDDGRVLSCEFFANEKKLGDAYGPLTTPMGAWLLTWSNAPAGTYLVTARATDDHGNVATSPPVRLIVRGEQLPPPILTILQHSAQGGMTLLVLGHAGRTNVIEASTDLVGWTGITTNVMDYSLCPICPFITFQDPASTNLDRRFYRSYELP
jgi:hypothetical protein